MSEQKEFINPADKAKEALYEHECVPIEQAIYEMMRTIITRTDVYKNVYKERFDNILNKFETALSEWKINFDPKEPEKYIDNVTWFIDRAVWIYSWTTRKWMPAPANKKKEYRKELQLIVKHLTDLQNGFYQRVAFVWNYKQCVNRQLKKEAEIIENSHDEKGGLDIEERLDNAYLD